MQMEMRNRRLPRQLDESRSPARYHKLFSTWFAFGFPAFGAVMGIFWLMIQRPSIW
jgi:uncharacterized membrane protein